MTTTDYAIEKEFISFIKDYYIKIMYRENRLSVIIHTSEQYQNDKVNMMFLVFNGELISLYYMDTKKWIIGTSLFDSFTIVPKKEREKELSRLFDKYFGI